MNDNFRCRYNHIENLLLFSLYVSLCVVSLSLSLFYDVCLSHRLNIIHTHTFTDNVHVYAFSPYVCVYSVRIFELTVCLPFRVRDFLVLCLVSNRRYHLLKRLNFSLTLDHTHTRCTTHRLFLSDHHRSSSCSQKHTPTKEQ